MQLDNGCLAKNYLPNPPRLWERTHATCEIIYQNIDENGMVFMPFFNKMVPASKVGGLLRMLYKGNILQYPSPSTSTGFTKKMNYARICKGFGKHRKKSWATQTDTYTSPNTSYLQRTQSFIISNNVNGEISLPECIQPIIPDDDDLPEPALPVIDINDPPFPVDNEPSDIDIVNFPIRPERPIINPSLIDGGKLVICSRENVCSGVVQNFAKKTECFPTSDSNVPGPIINLCYPSNFPTFYPRVRKTYTNTSTKWPINGITSIAAFNNT